MAAVVGDYGADHSRFHVDRPSRRHHEHSAHRETAYHTSIPQRPRSPQSSTQSTAEPTVATHPTSEDEAAVRSATPGDRVSQPSSRPGSSTANPSGQSTTTQNANAEPAINSMSTQTQTSAASATTDALAAPQTSTPPPPEPPQQGQTIVVRDLAHIEALAREDGLLNGSASHDTPLQAMKYEISSMPIGDVIEMVAALLTKITTTNDLQHDALHRNAAHQQTAASHNNDGASMTPLSSSVLAFHGKNVPAITILSYLSRIHKYCPTTYEVFLSLLVYFDRMTERVNNMVMQAEQGRRLSQGQARQSSSNTPSHRSDAEMPDKGNLSDDDDDETDSDLADDEDQDAKDETRTGDEATSSTATTPSLATYFVVDSFNIHRLIIAGVTCASKFFSDVFYTNSRYAKVGGLPLAELNHLELQFLVLNDFRLSVPVEDLEAYATMLVEFYAREVVGQRAAADSDVVE